MMVVVGIIILITGLTLANNNRFGGQVQLQNLAYDMALSVRQAQAFGTSVQRFGTTFGAAYGMHFQNDATAGAAEYVLFADALTPSNGLYDCPSPGTAQCELVQSTVVTRGYKINDLCATNASGGEQCGLENLDITFLRPEPDAYIRSRGISGISASGRIQLISPKGDTDNIIVNANGQVSVCPKVDAAGQCI